MRTCASGDIFRNQICQMCCLLYFWEYTEIPHLDKVPNFPSLDSLWFISSRKSCRSFPPKFAPFWLASLCRANVENVATMFLRQTRRQGPMPCPPFNMWKEAAFQRNKITQCGVHCSLHVATFSLCMIVKYLGNSVRIAPRFSTAGAGLDTQDKLRRKTDEAQTLHWLSFAI